MRAKARQVVAWVKAAIRTLREVPRAIGRWLRSHASHCVTSVWLSGMVVFGATTTRRVLAAQAPEEAVAEAATAQEATEVVEMLDVDEMNAVRDRRMHAHGLAAADGVGPDAKTIQSAREAQARNIEIDGERVATAGNIAVVTRGGIAGWLKRNRGKKADPETLAWLRGEEAAEGRESYAGWADREDGNVLSWAKDKRRAMRAASVSAGSENLAPATDADRATPRKVATRNARSLGVQGLPLAALGGAAASALIPRAPIDPPPAQLAALRDRLQTIGSGAIAVSLRDHRVLVTLLCDQLFEHDRPELSERGTQVVRGLSRLLAGDHSHAYNVAVDRERAFELLSNLAIAGLPPERVDLALKKRDSAIDVVEVAWIDAQETP